MNIDDDGQLESLAKDYREKVDKILDEERAKERSEIVEMIRKYKGTFHGNMWDALNTLQIEIEERGETTCGR